MFGFFTYHDSKLNLLVTRIL